MYFSYNLFIFISSTLFLCVWSDGNEPCGPSRGTKLLYRKHVYRQALKGLAQDVYVAYPKDNDVEEAANVDVVDFCVTDHDPNLYGTKGVFAYSVEDDMDRKLRQATIILRGQVSRAINSTVEFYGFRKG